ncbi:DNA-processing protein DprA [Orbaceae bacterium ESL0721]|nr:DNA-processing protein DprA [Orbaceae bacterium ESL0721]
MIGQGKLQILKKIAQLFPHGLPDDIDSLLLIKELGLGDKQQKLFLELDEELVQKTVIWLNHSENGIERKMIAYCDPDYPLLLKQISAPPSLLFVLGNHNLLSSPQIAMVGSRNFSEYGAAWGRYFASELAINGITITSGLAMGIDAICHRGALDVAGNTVAVLGSGLNAITPQTNHRLAKDILSGGGAIISEFLPHIAARPEYFPRRNRIISGVSLGTFVVEASTKSGSLITARYALEQNRDVFALPGEINSDNCSGTHWLIKQGAYLVTNPTDILEHYHQYVAQVTKSQVSKSQGTKSQTSTVEQVVLHPEIFAIVHNQPTSVDRIAEQLSLSIPEVTIKLMDMELAGLIKTVTGGYVRNHLI